MIDREKVIQKLEKSLKEMRANRICIEDVIELEEASYDALAVLKEQEPRVLPWEKVDKSGNTYVWAEIRSFITDEKALIYCKIVNSEFFHEIYRLREESGMEWARTKEDYNRDDSQGSHSGWRCWTARPTEEQRKAVKWE